MQNASGLVFMSGGITYDGHISMLGITELELGSSENSYSRARKRSVIVVLMPKYAAHTEYIYCTHFIMTIGCGIKQNKIMMTSKTEHNFQYKIFTPTFQMYMKILTKILITYYTMCIAN